MKGSLAETTYLIRGRPEVVKWFTSPTKVFIANFLWLLASSLNGHPHLPHNTPQTLLQNEVSGRESARRLGLSVPAVTSIGDGYILQEYIQAHNALDYCRGFPAERGRILYEYGRRLAKLHKAGLSKGDTRIQNLLITRAGKLVDVDYEMSGRLSSVRRCLDVYVFLHSLGTETPTQQKPFFDGYGEKPREPWPLDFTLRLGMPIINLYNDLKPLLQSRRR
jgi:tRNA A-37 threonylcarbamoyl transferase component Bud32